MRLSRSFYYILALIFIALLIAALMFLYRTCPIPSTSALPQTVPL